MYIQRYIPHFPAAGEVVIFDRSWYNRAGVERVMGFCTRGADRAVPRARPDVEKAMVDVRDHPDQVLAGGRPGGADPAAGEPHQRSAARSGSSRRMDLKSYSRWYDYSRARDDMFAATDTAWAPWYVVASDDKKRARLNIIAHLLSQIPYEPAPNHPGDSSRGGSAPAEYREIDYPFKFVPDTTAMNSVCGAEGLAHRARREAALP